MAQRKVNCEVYTDRGIVGKDGAEGKSAYQQAVEGGYQGTEEEFEQALASDISTVANNVTNINVVGNNIENVNTTVDNMAAIIAAPTAATQAAASASQASTSASNASTSASNAAISASEASTNASNAATSASQASASASNASTSASEAAASATQASTSASNAQMSETNAATSASNAATSATNASASATTASTSASEAATSATQASTSASNAQTSETNAAASESNAAASASNASASAIIATTKASEATASAANASASATSASASATSANEAATSASISSANAEIWAEGTDAKVTTLGGEHSSKGWANVSKQYAESIGSALKYKGSVSTYSALPSTGQEIGDTWNVLDTGDNYAWTGTEWDKLSGTVDLSAYRTSADQDIIDAKKQDTITDLATIRSGAAAGATAVQPGDLATVATSGSYTDLTNKPTIPTVDSALSSTSTNAIQNKVVNTALAGKANATHTHSSGDIKGLATVATSGMYSDLTGTPGVATANTLGLVKPDGNTITVTEDGVISATGGSGSGFDFEDTKAAFDAAVTAGTITDDSVSLITDDISGDNVATKAELQAVDRSKVAKAGDTMTGTLKMSGQNEIRFGTDDNYYFIKYDYLGNLTLYKNNKGLFLHKGEAHAPYYWNGTKGYRLLTTADLSSSSIGENLAPDYSAAVTIPNNAVYTAPANGWIMGYAGQNDWSSYSLIVNNVQFLYGGRKSYNTGGALCFFIGNGQTVQPRADAILRFVPCIGA